MTTTPLAYECDGLAYVDRQNRIRRILAEITAPKASINVEEWSRRLTAVQNEVDELPLVIGVRYRIRMLGGRPETEAHHYRGDDGSLVHLDIPTLPEPEYLDIEGTFLGRRPAPYSWAARPFLIDIAGQLAMLTDSDVLRIEEIRP